MKLHGAETSDGGRRHHPPSNRTLSHQHDFEAVIIKVQN